MTTAPDGIARVRLADLDLGPELGDGGEGRVTEVRIAGRTQAGRVVSGRGQVTGDRSRGVDADAGTALVAKVYAAGLDDRRTAQLTHLVRVAPHLAGATRDMAWPQALVMDGDRVVGVLLPRAPAPFWATFTLRSGRTQHRLREVQYLLFPHDKLDRLGLSFAGLAERLSVLGAVVDALRALHRLGLVYGDLSARNILYGSKAAAYLLDCDGVALRGSRHVIGSPDWNDPASPETAQPATDVYKLGLLTTRMLTLNPTTRRAPSPGGAPQPLAPVLRAMVDPDPAHRPTIDDVAAALAECLPGPTGEGRPLPTWGMRPGTGELVRMDR